MRLNDDSNDAIYAPLPIRLRTGPDPYLTDRRSWVGLIIGLASGVFMWGIILYLIVAIVGGL